MNTPVYVNHLSHALGERVCGLDESARLGRLISPAADLHRAGFRQHRLCAPGTSAADLACRAVAPLAGYLAGTGAVIYVSALAPEPALAPAAAAGDDGASAARRFPVSELQARFGLEGALAFGITQVACTGMLAAVRVAAALLRAEDDLRQVLCVTADRLPDNACRELRFNLLSDGAAACLLGHESTGLRLLACHASGGGGSAGIGAFFGFAHEVVSETLRRASLGIADIQWLVPHNTSASACRLLCRLLDFDERRLQQGSLPGVGHAMGADCILNLEHLMRDPRAETGDRVLVLTAELGNNIHCAVFERVT